MKRRNFALLAGCSVLAIRAGAGNAASMPDASLLGTTLNPLGGEMAGNADGSIPAWTGGMTVLPAGLQPNDYVPELFPEEQPVLIIDATNVDQHAGRLSEAVVQMFKKYDGFKIKVYPTHRTAAAPQYVYDNTARNVGTAVFSQEDPVGGRFGFENAFGGVPFPIPSNSNPLTAGAQIIWNHLTKWLGYQYSIANQGWVVSNGDLAVSFEALTVYQLPYFDPHGSLATFKNYRLQNLWANFSGPPNLVGQELLIYFSTSPAHVPQQAWQLLNGQGRVRRAPEISFDTPASESDDICAYDEFYGFEGSIEKYDWRCLGKKEMYIPYNNNGLFAASPQEALLEHFTNPDLVRWELHRCWVVEATLHPGERNVLARRLAYIDEDTWTIGVIDGWDENNNIVKATMLYNYCRPDLPGVVNGNTVIHNLQTDDYVALNGPWNQKEKSTFLFLKNIPASTFDPQAMAASAQY